ncbi:MAG: EamA family transporter [Gemmatimonadota bacterium]
MSPANAPRFKLALAFAAIWVIWGSTYLAIAIGLETIPTFALAAGRFIIAAIAMYALARYRGAANPTLAQWRWAALLGFLFFVIGNGVVVFVEQRVSSGLTALLVAMVSAWTAIIEWLKPGGRAPTTPVTVGIVLGFAGAALLLVPVGGGEQVPPLDAGLLIFSTFAWALASVLSKQADLPRETTMTAAAEMICGAVGLSLIGLLTGDFGRVVASQVSGRSFWALIYLSVFGSLVAFTCFAWLLKVSTPGKVSTAGYINPMVAVGLGWAFHSEVLTTRSLIASAIIVVGVALIITGDNLVKLRQRQVAEPASESVVQQA